MVALEAAQQRFRAQVEQMEIAASAARGNLVPYEEGEGYQACVRTCLKRAENGYCSLPPLSHCEKC